MKIRLTNLKKEIFVFAISGLVILLFVFHLRQRAPNVDDAKFREVQDLSARVPVFSLLTQVGTNYHSSYTSVDLTKYYRSTADYDDVKAFYSGVLQKDDWTLEAEHVSKNGNKKLIFRRGQFSISVSYTNSSAIYNYAIDFVWRNRE